MNLGSAVMARLYPENYINWVSRDINDIQVSVKFAIKYRGE